MNDVLLGSHRAAAPSQPDAEALARVHDEAKRIARSRAGTGARRAGVWRIAASAAVAAAVIGAAVWVMTPHIDDSAFARQQAVAALLPREGVLHTKGTFTWEITTAVDGAWPTRVSTMEDWIDAPRKATRTEWRSPQSGALEGLDLRVGPTVRSLGRDGGFNQKTRKFVAGSWRLVQYPAPDEISSPAGGLVDMLREGIDTGKAKVVDRVTADGQEYWVVEMTRTGEDPATGSSTTTYRATMAVDDYALRDLVQRTDSDHPVDGKGSETIILRFSVWETVQRESLPSDFFSLGEVDKAAPAGTNVDAPPLGSSSE